MSQKTSKLYIDEYGAGHGARMHAGLFADKYQVYDFASIFDLNKIFGVNIPAELTFDVQNLTNTRQRSYFQFPNAAFPYYNAGRTFMVGVRGTF